MVPTPTVATRHADTGTSPEAPTSLRFGTYLAPNMLHVYQAIVDKIGRELGVETRLVVEDDYQSCRDDLNDVCFVCSLPYVMFEREGLDLAVPIAAPVLEGERYRGLPVYFSDVIVHRDSDFETFKDLRDATWAYNEPLSHSGYGVTRYTLVERELTGGFFGAVVEAGFHETAIRMVAAGEVDASAIDSQVLTIEMARDPELAESLRVVESLGPSTIQPVAVSKRIDETTRNQILEVVLGLHLDPALKPILADGTVSHFTAVGPESYDDIRRMVEVCEAAGFMTLR